MAKTKVQEATLGNGIKDLNSKKIGVDEKQETSAGRQVFIQ
jgi:hypothetical protein